MSPVKQFVFSAVASVDIGWLKRNSPLEVLIPYHHLVCDEYLPHIRPLYAYKNTRQFEQDLDFLLKHFNPVSLTELIDHQAKKIPLPQKSFLITFDDGLRQAYQVAAPILQRKGIPAAFFVNPAFVDNKTLFYDFKKGLILDKLSGMTLKKNLREALKSLFPDAKEPFSPQAAVRSIHYLNQSLADSVGELLDIDFAAFSAKYRPFMTSDEIRDLISKGFQIGSHSMDHPLYALIPPDEQLRQTLESTQWVNRHFQPGYKAFAFPHTDQGVSHGFFNQVEAGTKSGLDLLLGNRTAMLENHPGVLHRFIGENPSVSAERMTKAVLMYSILRKAWGNSYVKRGQ